MTANRVYSPTSLEQAQSIIQELQAHRCTLLDALYTAFPFVEDAEDDPCFKPGHVKKTIRHIRSVIDFVEHAMKVSSASPPVADACPLGHAVAEDAGKEPR